MDINQLVHFTTGTPGKGPFVLVLNDGAIITAEDRAMLQSLYSRSPSSVLEHLMKLAEVGSGKFMEQFYVGYGHKSIGDCGTTTMFVEGVSMLEAKAIQDWMLYAGQEVSTRYVDFTHAPFINPLNLSVGENPQEWLREFYVEAMPKLLIELKQRHPMNPGEKEGVYEKAINARAFDILRSMLAAGAATSLSWHTNLRQAADKLAYLRVHRLAEAREVAALMDDAIKQAHPHSFNHKTYEESEEYRRWFMENHYYFDPDYFAYETRLTRNNLDTELLAQYREVIARRPAKTELPKVVGEAGMLQFEFALDFGSFRDVQRQRAVIQRMGLLTPKFKFHKWYLEQMGEELRDKAEGLVMKIKHWHSRQLAAGADKSVLQYYLPMGYRVPCRITGDLPASVYLAELRSGSTVHPTLREVAQDMGGIIRELGVPVYIDESDMGRFDVKRGTQDITEKKPAS